MDGVTFKEIAKMAYYGYRFILNDNDQICKIYKSRNTEEEQEILRIYAFNENCKIRLYFVDEKKMIETDWAQIQPKKEKNGLNIFYEEDRLTIPKEILTN